MRIMVISDTHGSDWRFLDALQDAGKIDAIIHAGDGEGHEDICEEAAGVPFYYVAGNNDYESDAPRDMVFTLAGRRIFLTHGHRYRVRTKPELIRREARARHADILIYGHTHVPLAEQDGDLLVLNPGSPTYPYSPAGRPTYILLDLEEGKEPVWDIRYLD